MVTVAIKVSFGFVSGISVNMLEFVGIEISLEELKFQNQFDESGIDEEGYSTIKCHSNHQFRTMALA